MAYRSFSLSGFEARGVRKVTTRGDIHTAWIALVPGRPGASRPGPCRRGGPVTRRHRRIAGTSLQPLLPSRRGNAAGGQGNDLGYGKNAWDWTIRSEAPKGSAPLIVILPSRSQNARRQEAGGGGLPMGNVQRLSGGGLVASCVEARSRPA